MVIFFLWCGSALGFTIICWGAIALLTCDVMCKYDLLFVSTMETEFIFLTKYHEALVHKTSLFQEHLSFCRFATLI